MFKPFIIALFVVAVLLQSGFVALSSVYQIQAHKHRIKQEMKRQIQSGKHDAVLTVFSEADLSEAVWEHSREFFLNGSKYDLVRTGMQNGTKIFWCINDSSELELFKALDKEQNKRSVLNDVFKTISLNMSGFSSASLTHRLLTTCPYASWLNSYSFTWHSELFRPPGVA